MNNKLRPCVEFEGSKFCVSRNVFLVHQLIYKLTCIVSHRRGSATVMPTVSQLMLATIPSRSAVRRDLMVVNVEEMLDVSVVFVNHPMHLVSAVNAGVLETVAQMVRFVSIEMGHLFLSAVQRRIMVAHALLTVFVAVVSV